MHKKDITPRTTILFIIEICLFAIILIRLIFLQFFYKDYYKTLSDRNCIKVQMVPALRGVIYDRTGKVLAANQSYYRGYVYTQRKKDFEKSMSIIKNIIDIDVQHFEAYKKNFFIFKDNLDWEDMAKLELYSPDIPGLYIEESSARYYPYQDLFSHALGYTSKPSRKDISKDPMLNIPGLCIGHGGSLEEILDINLRGAAGWQKHEIDARQCFIRTLDTYKGEPGSNVYTTLRADWQKKAYNALKDRQIKSACIVVMDVHTGDIPVFLSYPGYNPNDFSPKMSQEKWLALQSDEDHPLLNKITQGLYSPGSVFKMVVAAAALKYKCIDPKKTVHCSGFVEYGGHRFHCWAWKNGGHGAVDLDGAITRSCDVYFYHLAMKLSINQMADTAAEFGFGKISGLGFFNEKSGQIPNQSWFSKLFGQAKGEALNLSIGQGRLLVTPLQLLLMTACFANGGCLVEPKLLKDQPVRKIKISIDDDHIESIKNSMIHVVEYGTGKNAGFSMPTGEIAVGGKTSTSQVKRITLEERRTGAYNNRAYQYRDHAIFVGFTPALKPQYAIVAVIEHGGWGGATAAPIAKDILEEIIYGDS